MAHVLDRVEGKVADRLETTAVEPGQMSASELERWLLAPSAEERLYSVRPPTPKTQTQRSRS